MSRFLWLPPLTLDVSGNDDNSFVTGGNFDSKQWKILISKTPGAENIVVPILAIGIQYSKQNICFCWIDKTRREAHVFSPHINNARVSTRFLMQGLGIAPNTTPQSPAAILGLKVNKNNLKPGESHIDENNFIVPIFFNGNIKHSIWCVYYLIRRTGVSSWIPLVDEVENNNQRLNAKLELVLTATLRLMRACVRSGSLETYMRMFEKGETYGINANNMKQLYKIFLACSPSTSLSYKADLKTLIEAINGIESTSQDETPLKKVKILGGIVERNDLTDKDTRDKMRAFIPNNPQMARFPVFRV